MFDALTAAALADQLSHEIGSGRIQQLGLISRQAVWFEIFANRRRKYLIANAETASSSIYLTDREPIWDRQLVTPLLLLLRKYARGGRIVSIQQPPLERVITFSIAATGASHRNQEPPSLEVLGNSIDADADDDDDDNEDQRVFTHLHCELMGKHGNLILVDDNGLIMESAKRVTPAMSRVRPIAPRIAFTSPPPRLAADPRSVTEAEMAAILDRVDHRAKLVKALPSLFRGMSPVGAREAVFQASAPLGASAAAAGLARAIRHLYEPMLTGAWRPVVYRDDDGAAIEYAAIPMAHLASKWTEQIVDTISAAIEAGGVVDAAGDGRHAIRSSKLVTSITAAIDRIQSKLDALDTEESRHQDRERYRVWGESIFGYLWQIKPGDTELVIGDERVPLDSAIDPREQARNYLQQYRDGKSADQQIGRLREETGLELQYLTQLRVMAEQAVGIQDIEDIEGEWRLRAPAARGKSAPRSSVRKRSTPAMDLKGNLIYVGRSGGENDRVTFDIAGPDDAWLHARGVPGSHVIVRWMGTNRDDEAVLLRAAELAAWFSQARSSGKVEVDITTRRHVRKIKGAGPGMVTYRNERTVSVSPVGPD